MGIGAGRFAAQLGQRKTTSARAVCRFAVGNKKNSNEAGTLTDWIREPETNDSSVPETSARRQDRHHPFG
jgi:hypothetical protein